MTAKEREEKTKRKKIILFFGMVIVLTLAFAIKKIYIKTTLLNKKQEGLSLEDKKTCPMMIFPFDRLEAKWA